MDAQLAAIIDLARDRQLPYWLHFGTLLGLMREGDVLGHDSDIDLGMWASDEEHLRSLLPALRDLGYRVKVLTYRGAPYQYKLDSRGAHGRRLVDVHLFRDGGDHAWCPQPTRFIPEREPAHTFFYYVGGANWRLVDRHLPFAKRMSVTAFPFSIFIRVGTWWIPSRFYRDLAVHEPSGASIPADWEGYLKLQYGDWKTPNTSWNFWRDSGGLERTDPRALLADCGVRVDRS